MLHERSGMNKVFQFQRTISKELSIASIEVQLTGEHSVYIKLLFNVGVLYEYLFWHEMCKRNGYKLCIYNYQPAHQADLSNSKENEQ
jgi:hypothetical protein